MRCLAFAGRNGKEIVRDKLTLFFGILFPILILALMSLIGRSVPADIFPIASLAPGIAVFGLSFLSLFAGMLVARDRSGAFMTRLLASPMRPADFILGYLLPLLPVGLAQSLACLVFAALFGLRPGPGTLLAAAVLLPMGLFYAALGLLLGSLLTEKQIGGVCGALVTNCSAWLSGVWFDPASVGGAFAKAVRLLPFLHATQAARAALALDLASLLPHLWPTLLWSSAMTLASVWTIAHRLSHN